MSRRVATAFDDPVFEAQAAFRAVLNAMARPGTAVPLAAPAGQSAPGQILTGPLATLLLTLADHTTPIHLGSALQAEDVVGPWLAFHTGARCVDDPKSAHFIVVTDAGAMPALADLEAGSDIDPEHSATVFLAVETLSDGPQLMLAGPGINGTRELRAAPLPGEFTAFWAANGIRFPRGIDLILATASEIAALPRTTRITGSQEEV